MLKFAADRGVNRIKYPHFWGMVYFHGRLEDELGYDLVLGEGVMDTVQDGVHDVKVYGKKAKLFLWTEKSPSTGHAGRDTTLMLRRHGLIVRPRDKVAYNYAKECFEKKVNHL